MKRITYISLLLLGFLLSTGLSASIDDKNKKADDKTKKKDDTTSVVLDDNIFLDEVDSLLMFPSHDLYGNWDTALIHPYLFDKNFQGDTAVVYLTDDWSCGFSVPYKGLITSGYGWRRRRPHYGTDINLETGDTVVAAFDGKVRIARLNKSYGNVVIVRHNNGLETVYAHLSKLLVEPGQSVTSGEVIGLGGNTGHSYGSHLHFEVRFLGRALDTEDLIDYSKGEVKNSAFVICKSDFDQKYDLRSLHNHKKHKSYTTSKSHIVANAAKGKSKMVMVKQGDTLSKIAKRNHTTIANICKKNGIKQTKVLQPGMKLKV